MAPNPKSKTVTFVLQADLVKDRTYKTSSGEIKKTTYMNLPTGPTPDDHVIIREGVQGRMGTRNPDGTETWKNVDLSNMDVSGYAFTPTRPVNRFTNKSTGIEYRSSNNWNKDTLVYLQNVNGFDPATGKSSGVPAPRIAIRAEDLYNALEDKKQRYKENHPTPDDSRNTDEERVSVKTNLVDSDLENFGLENEDEF